MTTLNRRGQPKQSPLVDGKNQRQLRQERAKEREQTRTPTQQLAELDRRLGVNTGAVRERIRLIERMRGAA